MSKIVLSLLLIIGSNLSVAEEQSLDFDKYNSSVGLFVTKNDRTRSVCTGVLINPSIVLTAAHCLVDLKRIRVTTDFEMARTSRKMLSTNWIIHPDYLGNDLKSGGSIDFGLIVLTHSVKMKLNFPELSNAQFSLPFERIGYGLRNDANKRTFIMTQFNAFFAHYISVKDEFGMPGDSGGPVYQTINNQLKLVGVHTGRQVDAEGVLKNISYMQLIDQNVIDWINIEISRNSCGPN